MDERVAGVLPDWQEPEWEAIPAVSVAGLRERLRALNPRNASSEELVDRIRQHFSAPGIVDTVPDFDSQLRHIADVVLDRGWAGLYLVCRYAQAPVRTLYLVQGELVSREALLKPEIRKIFRNRFLKGFLTWGLQNGGSGYPRDTIERLKAELNRLGLEDDTLTRFELEQARIHAARRIARQEQAAGRVERRELREARKLEAAVQAKAKAKADVLRTWAVLRRTEGRGRPAAWAGVDGLSLAPDAGVALVQAGSIEALSGPAEPLNDHLHIDLRVLCKETRYWRPGTLFVFPLREGVLVGLDLRSDTEPHVVFAFHFGGRMWLQRVELRLQKIGGRVRPVFVCPVAGSVEVLAFREGRFASIRAQCLQHPSTVRNRAAKPTARPRKRARRTANNPPKTEPSF